MFLQHQIVPRELYSSEPSAQNSVNNNPTLLLSWWCTGFALTLIIVRLSGRYIRTEKLFMEDKIMAWSMIPLLTRMALVHLILRWGTNNARVEGLSADDLWYRELGSKLVLPARISYAAFIWIAKLTISEFLKRLYTNVWKRSYEIGLQAIRWFLLVTFVAVVIATLAECQPFDHYWQVVPEPGARCRQGYVQLVTMGVADIITDLVLVCFPTPIVIMSNMRVKRKLSLVLLFGLSLILVAITLYRVYGTIQRHSNQQFRSLMASLEILAAAAIANALVLGSFVRDRGVKKQRYRFGSMGAASSLDRPGVSKARTRAALGWGSDVDLAENLGLRLGPEFMADQSPVARPAPAVLSLVPQSTIASPTEPGRKRYGRESADNDETDLKPPKTVRGEQTSPRNIPIITPRRMSFFDVGGLLDDDEPRNGGSSSTWAETATYPLRSVVSSPARQQRLAKGGRTLLEEKGASFHI